MKLDIVIIDMVLCIVLFINSIEDNNIFRFERLVTGFRTRPIDHISEMDGPFLFDIQGFHLKCLVPQRCFLLISCDDLSQL